MESKVKYRTTFFQKVVVAVARYIFSKSSSSGSGTARYFTFASSATELWHFQSHVVPKNVKFSKEGIYFIFFKVTTLKSPFLTYIGLEA